MPIATANSPLRVLVIGASYGLLPAAKIAAAGHSVTVVGRIDEVASIARDGVEIEFSPEHILRPPMSDAGLSFSIPDTVDPTAFNLVLLAIMEPQVRSTEICNLLKRINGKVPVASIMNMPPPPYLARISSLPKDISKGAYEDPTIWEQLPPDRMTLASADPQAFKPDMTRPGHLKVTHSSNFKFAPFARQADQMVLERITRDASRTRQPWGKPPVNMLTRSSIFVPLSKWPMLVTGNCRCLCDEEGVISINRAVTQNLDESRLLYDSVNACLETLGCPKAPVVPFDAYLQAAEKLSRISSLAGALNAGSTAVERIDLLVLNLMLDRKANSAALEIMTATSLRISKALNKNRTKVL